MRLKFAHCSSQEQWREALGQVGETTRIVHLSGELVGDRSAPLLRVGREQVKLSELFEVFSRHSLDALMLDVAVASPDARVFRNCVALEALDSVNNVVLLAENADAITREACFEQVYSSILAGFPLWRAVVEARKRLQKTFVDSAANKFERPYGVLQSWPLLVHYGRRDVALLAQPIAPTALEESGSFAETRRKMFGFSGEHLRAERFFGGENAWARAACSLASGSVPVLVGKSGTGKTRLLHVLAFSLIASGDAAFGFYWDFARDDYSSADIVQMVAGAIGVAQPEQADETTVLRELGAAHALLVLDNFDRPASAIADEGARRLLALVDAVRAAGARCIVSCRSAENLLEAVRGRAGFEVQQMPPLSVVEGAELVARATSLGSRPKALSAVVNAAGGSPFFLYKLGALCSTGSEEARAECVRTAAELALDRRAEPTEAFYAWRWRELAPELQRLLVSCLEMERFVLEFLMIGAEAGGRLTAAAAELWRRLGLAPEQSFSAAIATWERAGFLSRHVCGRRIDASASSFLQRMRREGADAPPTSELLAAVVCEGGVRLVNQMRKQQQPLLFQHLLANRAALETSAESLWSRGEYGSAAASVQALDWLLHQAGLGAEFSAWAALVLSRTDFARLERAAQVTPLAAWLLLASAALLQAPLSQQPALEAGIEFWLGWVELADVEDSDARRLLFDRAFLFLQRALDLQGRLPALQRLGELAASNYERQGRVLPMLSALKLGVACEHELGQQARSQALEERILHELEKHEVAAAARARVVLELASMRRKQGLAEHALSLLARLDRLEHGTLTHTIATEELRGLIELDLGQTEAAARRLCTLWKSVLEARAASEVAHVAQALRRAESALEATQFAAIYGECAAGTPTPDELKA